MPAEITHQSTTDEDTGRTYLRQIVTPQRLRQLLRRDGESLCRPTWFSDCDEWDVSTC